MLGLNLSRQNASLEHRSLRVQSPAPHKLGVDTRKSEVKDPLHIGFKVRLSYMRPCIFKKKIRLKRWLGD